MCGRYSFNVKGSPRLQTLARRLAEQGINVQTGEVAPGDNMAVVTRKGDRMTLGAVKWGFPGFAGSRPVINARAETVLDKPMFRDAFLARRCVFPSDAFYEWNPSHERFSFDSSDQQVIFLAGIIRDYPDGPRGVILTTNPNQDVGAVHDRMPLMVDEQHIRDWIMDTTFAQHWLAHPMDRLRGTRQVALGEDIPLDWDNQD